MNSPPECPRPKILARGRIRRDGGVEPAVPSWNPDEVKPITAFTKMVFELRSASFTRASAKDSGATSRKYPYSRPATRSRTCTGLVRDVSEDVSSPHTPSRGTHPHPLRSALSTKVDRGSSFASISGSPSSSFRASSTSSSETPRTVIPNFAARYVVQLPAEHQRVAPPRHRLDRADFRVQLGAGDHGEERPRRS